MKQAAATMFAVSPAIVVAVVKFMPAIVVAVPLTSTGTSAVVAAGEQRHEHEGHPSRVMLPALSVNGFHDEMVETNARNTRRSISDAPAASYDFASCRRMARSSLRRLCDSAGYRIFKAPSVSTRTCETISRAFFLSSAGTTYQGALVVLVALRQA